MNTDEHRDWYRVADLTPRLKPDVRLHRHVYRGTPWFVVQDPATGRFHRFSVLAHDCIRLMNGERTMTEVWHGVAQRVSQAQLMELLAQLHRADLLMSGAPTDADELVQRSQTQSRRQRRSRWRTPLAVRIPVFDPNALLDAIAPIGRALFSPLGAVVWITTVGSALILAGIHWAPLTHNLADRVLGADNLVLLALVFPLVKALHELGHGLAVKVRGGDVHETGIMLLVLFPVPYVEASAATSFAAKGARMLVGAAGMLVELFVAALAMWLWVIVEPGVVRTLCFNAMVIAGVSTLLFNGNPLLRFDAYYILMDAIEIPNLASRANRYLLYLVQRHVYGIDEIDSPVTASGERGWFVVYGVAAFAYRLFVMVLIASFVASKYFVIGVMLAAWAVAGMFLVPLGKGVAFLLTHSRLSGRRGRALAATALTAAALIGFITSVPLPHRTLVHGVVDVPEDARIRATHDGFLRSRGIPNGTVLAAGDPLLTIEAPAVGAQVVVLTAQLRELELRRQAVLPATPTLAASIEEEIDLTRERLREATRREASLELLAPSAGHIAWLWPDGDIDGRFVRRGDPVGYLVPPRGVSIRTAVTQDVADLVTRDGADVDVRFADAPNLVSSALLVRETPAATFTLPSPALGVRGGGEIATVPDGESERAYQSLFELELAIPEATHPGRLGGRVYVRFDHGYEPLAIRWYRAGRQLLLRQFNV